MVLRKLIISGLLCVFSTFLHAEYFVIDDYVVNIQVASNGVFEVTETINVVFSEPRHGIIRSIPYRYRIDGKNYNIVLSDISVQDFSYDTYKEGNNLNIKIGDADVYVEGKQQYIIRYKVKYAFLFLEEHTEFYWNLVGTAWETTISKVRFDVTFDKNLPLHPDDYIVYAGAVRTQEKNVEYSFTRNKISGETLYPLQSNDGVTIAVKLPYSYIQRPTKMELFWREYGWLILPLLIFGAFSTIFYGLWQRFGKDKPIVKMVYYVPPKDLTPSEAGVLIDDKADKQDVIALLPYWAHLRYLNIRQIEKKWAKDDYELIKLQDLPADATPYEKVIFDGLFEGQDTVLISSLKNSFYSKINSASQLLKSHLNSKNVYNPISQSFQTYVGIMAVLLLIGAFFVGFIFGSIALAVAFGLSAVVGFIISGYMLKKNEKGLQLYQEIMGFKMFMKAAEKDKLERMLKDDPNYFEKTLPYAMIFGYAREWGKKFDGLLMEPPQWFIGPAYYGSSFSAGDFGSHFESSMNEIQSVFTSQPSGSSGGSFGGGGSVGGGFGGGGGSSW